MRFPWAIPESWQWTTMGQVAKVVGGGTPSTKDDSNFDGGDIPWITPADLSGYREKYISRGKRNITERGMQGSGARLLPEGAVLFSSRAPIGYVAIASNPVTTNQGFKSFVLLPEPLPEYVYYYLQRARELAVALASGTTFLEISGAKAAEIPIPIAPLDEQKEIVAAIETQFARLDDAVAALERARTRLKRYRASVLKAACEGRLVPTEAELARQEGHGYEPASELLARVKSDRRLAFQAENKKPYAEPVAPSLDVLDPPRPPSWEVASLEALTSAVRTIRYGILMPKEHVEGGILYVKVKDIKQDRIVVSGLNRTTPEIAHQYRNASLKTGDVLLSIRGTYGRVAPVPPELEGGNITQDTARLAVSSHVSAAYMALYLRAPDAQTYFQRVAKGVAVKGVNIVDVRSTPIALPPLAEQVRIVQEVERRLSVLDRMEAEVAANLKRAASLRQAILRRAFSGNL